MLDGMARRLIDPPLVAAASLLARAGVSADALTGLGLAFGVSSGACVATGSFGLALLFLAASRLCDGLDGAVARLTRPSGRGGFIDIVSDFVFYGSIPLGFALVAPTLFALPAAFLLFCFYVNGATFLAFAAVAAGRGMQNEVRGPKSIYFTAGLAEGSETIITFVLMMLVPALFPALALLFGLACLVTAASRAWLAWTTLRP
jgi:phosphatidylglycerophosphate synthase